MDSKKNTQKQSCSAYLPSIGWGLSGVVLAKLSHFLLSRLAENVDNYANFRIIVTYSALAIAAIPVALTSAYMMWPRRQERVNREEEKVSMTLKAR